MYQQNNSSSIVGKIILISVLVIFYSSCQYDNIQKIVPVIPKAPWALDSSFWGENKFLTNSIKINESLLLVANSFGIWNVIPSNINKSISGNYIDMAQATSDLYPPSLSRDISVSVIDKDFLVIYNTTCAACPWLAFNPPYSNSSTSVKGLRTQIYFSG